MLAGLILAAAQDLVDARPPERDAPPPRRDRRIEIRHPDAFLSALTSPDEFLSALLEDEARLMEGLIARSGEALSSHALTFLCQVSPTLCNTLKHLRANAGQTWNGMREALELIDGIRDDPSWRGLGRMIRDCYRAKREAGKNPLEALRGCARDALPRDLEGKARRVLDLRKEIAASARLARKDVETLERVLRDVRISREGVELAAGPPPLLARFRERQSELRSALAAAADGAGHADGLRSLGLTESDLARLSSLPRPVRESWLSAAATSLAAAQLQDEADRVALWLRQTEADPAVPEYVRDPAARMLREIEVAREAIRLEAEAGIRIQEAVLRFRRDIDRQLEDRLLSILRDAADRAGAERRMRRLRAWEKQP